MALQAINPTTTPSWEKLNAHFKEMKDMQMHTLFSNNPQRAQQFSIQFNDFMVDYSKNRITKKTIDLLLDFANEMQLKNAIEQQFSGEIINKTEQRAVLHTALRNPENEVRVHNRPTRIPIKRGLKKMKRISKAINNGNWEGYTGKKITDIVNIGIGGSDLGSKMIVEALQFYKKNINTHFVSNVDGDHVQEILQKLDRETTVFIVVSKSFTTQETLQNTATIEQWFLQKATILDVQKHFIAVTNNEKAAMLLGIPSENILSLNDWVGGRFSLWSTVGLSIACSIGFKRFQELLQGAYEMDVHFKNEPFKQNIPVVLALLSVWYNNFFNTETEAIVPYSQYLEKMVSYLQQAIMESNGKNVDRNGNSIDYQTGTVIWGATGTNAQHAFFQLLHQGTKLIPTDFIGFVKPLHGLQKHHDILMANYFSQTEALLIGKKEKDLQNEGVSSEIISFKIHKGNKPTNSILITQLTPKNLGALIAMYEHKLFVQGVLWNIFSYDQMGVELGKQLSTTILEDINGKKKNAHDVSTEALLAYYLKKKQ